MKTKLLFTVLMITFIGIIEVSATVPERKGWWKFDDAADMLKADIGAALVLTGTQESVNGPVEGNLATQIGLGSYLTMNHGITANGGGTLVNEFTLQMDFLMPESSLWHAMYQTAADNSDDAELFINTDNLIGAWRYAYSTDVVAANTWYRMIVTVKNGEFIKIYMNGQLWIDGSAQDVDGRDALQTALLLFADNDGEDNTMQCAEVGIWDVALTGDEALELGDATTAANGVFNFNTNPNANDLGLNYPNPVQQITNFTYQVQNQSEVTFHVIDMSGKEVTTLNEGVKAPGNYNLTINTNELNNGIYYVKMVSGKRISMQKMVVAK